VTKTLIALVLLSPLPLPVPRHVPKPFFDALKQHAETLEVWPAKSNGWNDDFRSELCYVRIHMRQLADAPSLADADFLPPRLAVLHYRATALRLQLSLERRRDVQLHHADAIDALLCQARRDSRLWAAIDVATDPDQTWPARREALRELREAGVVP
jgi:hypothetical protein